VTELHSPLRVVRVRSISEIPRTDWEAVYPAVLENYTFFKTLDESGFDQFSFFYIMVYRGDKPVGAVSCFTMRFGIDMTVTGFLKQVFGLVRKILPDLLSPNVLMVGLPMGMGRIGLADVPQEVLEVIRFEVEKLAAAEKAAMVIYKDFTGENEGILSPLLKKGYFKIQSIPTTIMDIRVKDFEEYLLTLGKVSRDGLKRNLKKVDTQVKIEFSAKDALNEQELEDIHRLYLQTFRKLDMGLEKLPVDFFRVASGNMPSEAKYFLWRIEGKMVAFAFCLVKGDYFIDYYLGFDYDLSRKYYLYYIRFRDLLRWCIDHKIATYEMGVTSYESKRRLGFRFVRLYFYIKHCNPVINFFGPLIKFFFSPEHFDPVFKEMKEGNLV